MDLKKGENGKNIWLYINGIQAVFEGGIKRGPTRNSYRRPDSYNFSEIFTADRLTHQSIPYKRLSCRTGAFIH